LCLCSYVARFSSPSPKQRVRPFTRHTHPPTLRRTMESLSLFLDPRDREEGGKPSVSSVQIDRQTPDFSNPENGPHTLLGFSIILHYFYYYFLFFFGEGFSLTGYYYRSWFFFFLSFFFVFLIYFPF
jgi:hypothetical protein